MFTLYNPIDVSLYPMLWLKAFHLIMMVCWFAGLFYLPRLFVYHSLLRATEEPIGYERFCTMEKRLYWGITTPSAIFTLILGIGLLHMMYRSVHPLPFWLTAKLGLIGLLLVFHIYCGWLVRQFRRQQAQHSTLFYRLFNEFPVIILIATILLAVLKPMLPL